MGLRGPEEILNFLPASAYMDNARDIQSASLDSGPMLYCLQTSGALLPNVATFDKSLNLFFFSFESILRFVQNLNRCGEIWAWVDVFPQISINNEANTANCKWNK